MALQQRVNQDAKVTTWLHMERDELRQTTERLCLEHGTVHEEHDRAVREHNEERQVVSSLRADLGVTMTRRLEAKNVSAGLGTELTEV